MWILLGLLVSLALGLTAILRSRAPSGHFDGDVYGMTPVTHRRYAAVGALLAILFALAFVRSGLPVIPMLGVTMVTAVFYAASFLRGAEADD